MGSILSRIDILGIEEEVVSKKETEKVELVNEGKGKDLGKVECNKEKVSGFNCLHCLEIIGENLIFVFVFFM